MFQEYFNSIQKDYLADTESSEHTYRTYLQNLLKTFEKEYVNRELIIKHEPANQEGGGRPDFKITTKEQLTIGLIETKKIGENLGNVLTSKQLERYKQLSDNIILTDYLQFYLIKNGVQITDVYLFSVYNLHNKRFKIEQSGIDELSMLFKLFFESEPETIGNIKDLAEKLSVKAILLREFCQEIVSDKTIHTRLHALMQAFKITLLPDIDPEKFADIYAQTLTYSLYLSGLNCNNPAKELEAKTAYSYLPKSFSFIREIFHLIDDFPDQIKWAIDEIITILKVTDYEAIQKEFADYRQSDKGFSDPYIYFYEDFLYHYDKNQRKIRGVYYTPEPVVSFIVRSIEQVLIDDFGIRNGFIGNNVTVLDFACGTGTFLLNVFALAMEQAKKLGDIHVVKKMVNEKLINNFYGFELLVAPYVVAHLKISEYLKDQGCEILPDNRLHIYLTNTLSNKKPVPFDFMPSLSEEGAQANRIKNEDILVIIGNPPYSGHSANITEWADLEMKEYYKVDGKPLGERNPKWLQDDYVKFIRFAQWKMDKVERGIVGIISNHSYLDNPTFRGMRQSLMKSFNEIYILDLHGNTKKKEKSPDGSKDENVFDIQQGVSIALFIKKPPQSKEKKELCKVHHQDLFGLRQNKYNSLLGMVKNNVKWNIANPNKPFYLFKPRDERQLKKYDKGWGLPEIFKMNSVGIVTSRDHFVIDMDSKKLKQRINDFKNLSIPSYEISQKFGLKENSKFKVEKSRNNVNKYIVSEYEKKFCKINYRPFDNRYLFYDDALIERMRKDIMVNMQDENIGIVSVRQVSTGDFRHVFITDSIIESCFVSNYTKEINYNFPLFILSNGEEKMFFGMVKEPQPEYNAGNLTKSGLHKTENFTKEFRPFFDNKYEGYYTPEQIMGYIYAVLHSPAYREKYIEFLKIDFPRIPFTDDEEMFQKLSKIGEGLIDAHLMKEESILKTIECKCIGEGNNFKVEKVLYDKSKVWINETRYFEPVPIQVWEFHIGGYQVLDKWLKERKKHEITLSVSEDVQHFIKVVNVLDYTIKTMEKIDELTREWI